MAGRLRPSIRSIVTVSVLILLFCLGHALALPSLNTTGQCYFSNPAPYRHYSTKTLYEDVRGKTTPQEQIVSGCEPSLFYLLARHGSRYPSDDDIMSMGNLLPGLRDRILQNFYNGNSSLCDTDAGRLSVWNFTISLEQESKLADVGYQELHSLAQRFQTRFPTLLSSNYDSSDIQVSSTYKTRTQESGRGFLEGLFNRTDIDPVFRPKGQDKLLRFTKACKRYQSEVDDKPVVEQDRFLSGSVYKQMMNDVEARLGFAENSLTKAEVFAMYRMCVYDHVLLNNAPWCAAFSEDNLKVIEYSEDLEYYNTYGHGAPALARDQTCELMKDLFTSIRNGSSKDYNGPRVILRFGHSQTFQPFIAKLGLFKDQTPPTADNMATQDNRKWKTSTMGPFGANIAFVVYRCQGNMGAKIQTYFNDKPLILPGCAQNICELNQALPEPKAFADSCDFDKVCESQTGMSSPLTPYLSLALLSWIIALLLG